MKKFKAEIYKIGINAVADVPASVTKTMEASNGRIKIKGTINGHNFSTTLMPTKNETHLLYVNIPMLKGAKVEAGDTAVFAIEQNFIKTEEEYPMPKALLTELKKNNVTDNFKKLSPSRQKDILKYLSYIKTEETRKRNIDKVIAQLLNKEKNVRIP